MFKQTIAGLLMTLIGAVGLIAVVRLVYFTDEHNRQLFTLGMPGDLLFALGALLLTLGGLGVAVHSCTRKDRRRNAGRS